MHDLAIIIPSMREAHWLEPCLRSLPLHDGPLAIDVVVVDIDDNGHGDDDTAQVVAQYAPTVRRIITHNGGFAHANNAGLAVTDARYVLLLNADTTWVKGDFTALVSAMDRRPGVGIAGVRQLTPDGAIYPTMRRFTSVRRRLAEALYCERYAPSLGHRVLNLTAYALEQPCDWTIGSFMLCRREALQSAGWLDERFFFCSEEEDLCWRVRQHGWEVVHLPSATIVHHVGKRGVQPRFVAQQAYAARQLVSKRDRGIRRLAFDAAQVLYYGLRAGQPGRDPESSTRRTAARRALRASVGLGPPPFRTPPPTSLPAGPMSHASATAVPPTSTNPQSS